MKTEAKIVRNTGQFILCAHSEGHITPKEAGAVYCVRLLALLRLPLDVYLAMLIGAVPKI
jgi:hypothetical protein